MCISQSKIVGSNSAFAHILNDFSHSSISLQNNNLECVSRYKYLGIWFNNSGSFNFAQNELVRKPFKLKSDFLVHNTEVKTSIHVFDHTIKPILLYGCEILGYFTVYLMVQKWKHSNRPNIF